MKKLIYLILLISTNLFSQTTSVFNLQGILRTPTGQAVADKSYSFLFKIYDVAEGGARLGNWEETQDVLVQNGVYNVLVGGKTAFAGLAFDKTYFVGISVDGGSELTPRIRLTASPYALSVQGTDNKMPNSGAMQLDDSVWHKSSDGKERILFNKNGSTLIKTHSGSSWSYLIPVGTIVAFAGTEAPAGWLLCDGASVSRTTYSDLFTVIGTTYGASTSSNFTIPNLNGRVPIGTGSSNTAWNSSTSNYTSASPPITLGMTGGTWNHKLEITEMPAHTHSSPTNQGGYPAWNGFSVYGSDRGQQPNIYPFTTGSSGGNQPHNNLPPYVAVNYIIKY